MLYLNLKPILIARGIERPFSYLVKAGFTQSTAHNLLHSNTSTFRLSHIEKLCLLLNCTPNDLLLWQNTTSEKHDDEHPLSALKKPIIASTNWLHILKQASLQDLAKINGFISTFKK